MGATDSRKPADPAHNGSQVITGTHAKSWGWLPVLSLVGALGLLLVALANNGARNSAEWARPLFWLGLLMIFGPISARFISTDASRKERIGLVMILGLELYLVKLLRSPLAFTFHDELLHWRTVNDIVQSGHLFQPNPLLPVSPLYPGLESITSALMSLGRMDIFSAGVVVVGIARLVLVLTLFLFYEEVSHSVRVASIASLLYMTEPTFVFFDAQFAYESVALPLAALTLLAAARRFRGRAGRPVALTLVVLLGLGAVVVTHHVTSYALLIFLALWAVVASRPSCCKGQPSPGWTTLLMLTASVTWMTYVASITIDYLALALQDGVNALVRVMAGEVSTRRLFYSGGQVAPLYEQLTAYASVGLILLGLPIGLLQIWRRHRANAIALVLAGGALAYPLSMAFRLTDWGMQLSVRTSPFIFVAIAFVLAIGIAELWLPHLLAWGQSVAFTAGATIIFVGGFVLGYPFWSYLPGRYLVSADMRSVEPQGVAAAEWMLVYLGPGNRTATDRINRLLMGAYGQQHLVTLDRDGVNVPLVFFSPKIDATEQGILQQGDIRYLVVDLRLSSGLPMVGTYFDDGEPNAFQYTTPIDSTALAKFGGLENVSRLFDSGDIVIYDVKALVDEP